LDLGINTVVGSVSSRRRCGLAASTGDGSTDIDDGGVERWLTTGASSVTTAATRRRTAVGDAHGDSAASSGQLLTTASVPRCQRTTRVGDGSGHAHQLN